MSYGITYDWLAGFAGGAAGLAAAGTGLALGALWAAGRGSLARRAAPFVAATLFFLALTQYPFPDAATMTCPVATARPNLRPFNYLVTMGELIDWGASLTDWLRNKHLAATVMNFAFCALIGAGLARLTGRMAVAAGFGLGLTLAVEATQATGFWWLWPCAWRQFNVDDLMMNLAGVVAGFALAQRASPQKLTIR